MQSFLFFSRPHFLKTILSSSTNGTFGFALPIAIGTQANPSAKSKSLSRFFGEPLLCKA